VRLGKQDRHASRGTLLRWRRSLRNARDGAVAIRHCYRLSDRINQLIRRQEIGQGGIDLVIGQRPRLGPRHCGAELTQQSGGVAPAMCDVGLRKIL
jgi:hypothetical protein